MDTLTQEQKKTLIELFIQKLIPVEEMNYPEEDSNFNAGIETCIRILDENWVQPFDVEPELNKDQQEF